MIEPALFRAGMIGASSPRSAAPTLLAFGLPLAGLGAWLAGASLIVLPLMIAGLGLFA